MTFHDFIEAYNKAENDGEKLEPIKEMFDDFKILMEGLRVANNRAYECLKDKQANLSDTYQAVQIIMFVSDKMNTIQNSFGEAKALVEKHNNKIDKNKV